MSDFDEWYKVYPRKVAKISARTAYDRIIRKGLATHAELLAGAIRYARERMGQEPQYTKHPATWLNGGCWEDEPGHSEPPIEQITKPEGAPSDAELRTQYEQRPDNIVELRPQSPRLHGKVRS